MSRRKQDRPQQRKTIYSLEQEKDLLVCGDCQTTFPLHDITRFIRHKVHRCNKENIDALDDADYDDEEAGPESLPARITSKQQSISAPITRKESMDAPSPLPSNATRKDANPADECMEESEKGEENLKERVPLKPKLVDAETNTSLTEPSKVICETCKSSFNSAWSLVQHAQKEHGIKIYTTPTPELSTPSPRLSVEHRTPPSSGPESPFPHPPHMFPPFRMPLDRPNPHGALSPFNRPPGLDFLDMSDPFNVRHRMMMHHSPFPSTSPFDRSRPITLEDFYSKRLQQLASTTGSPPRTNQTPPRPPYSPSAAPRDFRDYRDTRESREARETNPPAPLHQPPAVSSNSQEASSESGSNLSPRHKSCEFCGKSFRFPSNLIVHRRSHTGEKPFKCPLCPHACTQQSKLKRHMKTHLNNKSPMSAASHGSNPSTSDGSVASTSSTPDNNRILLNKAGYDLDEDDDDEEEEEEEEEEDMEEAMEVNNIDGELSQDSKYLKNGEAHETEIKKLENKSQDVQMNGGEDSDAKTPRSRSSAGTPEKTSLLSEVMVHSGLNNIQTYSEAFQQALKENSLHRDDRSDKDSIDKEKESSKNESSSPTGSVESRSKENIKLEEHRSPSLPVSHSNHLYGGSLDQYKSSVKREPPEPHHNSMDAAIYSRYWFPGGPLRDFYPSFAPGSFGLNHEFRRDPHVNGFGLAAPQDSALKSVGLPKPGPSVQQQQQQQQQQTPSNGPSPISRKNFRNDTCEFCGKVFRNCSNLTVHRRSHTGEKPYKCELCNYACAQSSKLTRHKRTHGRMGKDVYRCKFCQMPFSVASTLEKHMRKCVENRQTRFIQEADTDTNSTTASNH